MNVVGRIGVWAGGVAMLAATAIDTLAVIGRNIGVPMIGSIELVQVAVLFSGLFGLIFATVHDEHARVRILTDRSRFGRAWAHRIGAIATALFFAGLLVGSVWLAADLWDGFERSDLLGVSWRVLRLATNIGLAVCIVAALAMLFRRDKA